MTGSSKQVERVPKYCCPNCNNIKLMSVEVKRLSCGFIDDKAKEKKKDYIMQGGIQPYYFVPIEPFDFDQLYRFYCKECGIFFQDPILIPTEETIKE